MQFFGIGPDGTKKQPRGTGIANFGFVFPLSLQMIDSKYVRKTDIDVVKSNCLKDATKRVSLMMSYSHCRSCRLVYTFSTGMYIPRIGEMFMFCLQNKFNIMSIYI